MASLADCIFNRFPDLPISSNALPESKNASPFAVFRSFTGVVIFPIPILALTSANGEEKAGDNRLAAALAVIQPLKHALDLVDKPGNCPPCKIQTYMILI